MNTIPNDLNPLGKEAEPAAPEQPELPEGYTRLAFLRGTGNQYIDSGISLHVGMGTRIAYSEFTGVNRYLAGARSSNNYQRFYSWVKASGNDYTWAYGLDWHNVTLGAYPSGTVETNYLDNGFLSFIYGNSIVFQEEISASANMRDSELTLGIFCRLVETVAQGYAKANIHSMQISVGENIVRDYVPAVDPTGTPGLFDTVTQAFFTNDGGGAFVAGIETMDELFSLSDNLPAASEVDTNTTIALSLPGEFENDNDAQSYLIKIMAKGWTPNITYRS